MTEPSVTPQPEPTPTPEPQPAPVPATPEPTPEPAVQSWHDSLGDDALKTDEGIKKYKTLDDFAKAFKEKDSMIGRKGVILPNMDDPKDVDRYLSELGRPDEASKYESPEIQIEDELKQFFSDEKLNGFKDIAHKYGLTQAQFEGLAKDYTEAQLAEVRGIIQSEKKGSEESNLKLQNEWNLDYDANIKQAELAFKSFSEGVDKDTVDALLKNPNVKRIAFNISKAVSEDTFRKGTSSTNDTAQTLQAFIDTTVKDTKSSYYDQRAPDHKATRAKVKDAYAKLSALREAV